MSNHIQDEPQLPIPITKGKKGLWIGLFVAGTVFLLVIFMKAGSSTKDPKKAVTEASNADRTNTGEQTSKSVQDITDQMIGSDGSLKTQDGSVDSLLQRNIEQNMELASEEKFTNDRIDRTSSRRLPPSIDAYGHPITNTNNDHYGQGSTAAIEEKRIIIPNAAEGWDPEQDIIVPATGHTPAYRYQPAYLRGSNNHNRADELQHLDNQWLNSVNSSSYGHSVAVNAAFNEALPTVAIKQSTNNGQSIRINGYKGTKQPNCRAALSDTNVHKKWTIHAPGESK